MATSAQLTKLPRWAQDELARLTAELERVNALAIADAPANTNTFRQELVGSRFADLPLGVGTRIAFDLANGSRITAKLTGDNLDLTLDAPGEFTGLTVLPRHSNSVRLTTIESTAQ